MKMEIRCPIGGEVLVVINKNVITQEDIDLYKQMTKCKDHPEEIVSEEIIEE